MTKKVIYGFPETTGISRGGCDKAGVVVFLGSKDKFVVMIAETAVVG